MCDRLFPRQAVRQPLAQAEVHYSARACRLDARACKPVCVCPIPGSHKFLKGYSRCPSRRLERARARMARGVAVSTLSGVTRLKVSIYYTVIYGGNAIAVARTGWTHSWISTPVRRCMVWQRSHTVRCFSIFSLATKWHARCVCASNGEDVSEI